MGEDYSLEELIEGLKNKDKKIIEYLMDILLPKITKMVNNRSETHKPELVKEIYQETMFDLFKKVKKDKLPLSYHDKNKDGEISSTNLVFYTMGIARNKLNTYFKRKNIVVFPIDNVAIPDLEINDKEKKKVEKELEVLVLDRLKELDKLCQELLENAYLIPKEFKKKLKDIAEEKKMDYNAFRKRFYDCKKKLLRLVKQHPQYADIKGRME